MQPARLHFSEAKKAMKQRVEKTFAGRKLVIETGSMAKQAAGSALVQFGETQVLATVTVSENQSPLPFFPLTVEYKERQYAAGKIPGGFIKREGRPSDAEILSARIVDRSIRPLFPEGFKNEVQVFVYVISADQENDADVLALVATSFALNASKIPFAGPIAGIRVGRAPAQLRRGCPRPPLLAPIGHAGGGGAGAAAGRPAAEPYDAVRVRDR